MAGGGTSSERSQQGLGTLSLGPIGAAQAFGQQTGPAPGGGLTITGGGQILPQLFGPQDFTQLRNFVQPLGRFVRGAGDTIGQVGQQAAEIIPQTLAGIGALAQTGFVEPIQDLTSFLFENEILPSITERFGTEFGLDAADADTQAALLREGQRASLEAANLGVQNRIQGLQLAQGAPSLAAEELGAVEALLQQATRQGSEEGQLLDLFNTFGGLDTQAGGVGFGRGRSKNTSILG